MRREKIRRTAVATVLVMAACAVASRGAVLHAEEARAEDDVENPLLPILEQMGRRWGISLTAGRVALNPVQGTVVVRDVVAATKPARPWFTVDRMAIRAVWKTGQVEWARVEGASLTLGLDERLGPERPPRLGSLGHAAAVEVRSSSLVITAKGAELIRIRGVEGAGKGLDLAAEAKRLVATGELEIADGALEVGGGLTVNELRARGALEPDRLVVRSLRGQAGGGTVRCSGALSIAPAPRAKAASLSCNVETLSLRRGDVVELVVSGEVLIARRGQGVTLTGTLDVVSGTSLGPGRWGSRGRDAASAPWALDVVLRLKSRGRAATFRWRETPTGGVVVPVGRRPAPARIQRLLEQLEGSSPSGGGP